MLPLVLLLALTFEPVYFQVCAGRCLFRAGEEWRDASDPPGVLCSPQLDTRDGMESIWKYRWDWRNGRALAVSAQKTPPAIEVTDGAELSRTADSTSVLGVGSTERNGVVQ